MSLGFDNTKFFGLDENSCITEFVIAGGIILSVSWKYFKLSLLFSVSELSLSYITKFAGASVKEECLPVSSPECGFLRFIVGDLSS